MGVSETLFASCSVQCHNSAHRLHMQHFWWWFRRLLAHVSVSIQSACVGELTYGWANKHRTPIYTASKWHMKTCSNIHMDTGDILMQMCLYRKGWPDTFIYTHAQWRHLASSCRGSLYSVWWCENMMCTRAAGWEHVTLATYFRSHRGDKERNTINSRRNFVSVP